MEPSVGRPGVRHNISVNAVAGERAFVQRPPINVAVLVEAPRLSWARVSSIV
jgi:hypothetical protein